MTLARLAAIVDFLVDQVLYAVAWFGGAVLLGEAVRWSATHRYSALEVAELAAALLVLWYVVRIGHLNAYRVGEQPVVAYADGVAAAQTVPFDAFGRVEFRLPGFFPTRREWREGGVPGQGASRGSRRTSRRRLWTFRAIETVAAVLLVVGTMFAAVAICVAIPSILRRYNFTISASLVLGMMAYVSSRPGFLQHQNWKKLKEEWLTLTAVPTVFLVGFGAADEIGSPKWVQAAVKTGDSVAQVKLDAVASMLLLITGVFVVAAWLTTLGRQSMSDEQSQIPRGLFIASLICAWIASAGFYTITIYGFVVALCTRLPV